MVVFFYKSVPAWHKHNSGIYIFVWQKQEVLLWVNVYVFTLNNGYIAYLFLYFLYLFSFLPSLLFMAPALIYLCSISPSPAPPLSTPLPPPVSLSLCLLPPCMHPSDIAFLILLTGDNIYVLFFNIHFSRSYRPRIGPDTKDRHKTHKFLPPPLVMSVCFNALTVHFPLHLTHHHLWLLFLLIIEGK